MKTMGTEAIKSPARRTQSPTRDRTNNVMRQPRATLSLCVILALQAGAAIAQAQQTNAAPGLSSWCATKVPKPNLPPPPPGYPPNAPLPPPPSDRELVCELQPEASIDALYQRLATGPHLESRRLNSVLVFRDDVPGYWMFNHPEGRYDAAVHYLGAPAGSDDARAPYRIAVYCEGFSDCESLAYGVLVDGPLPADFARNALSRGDALALSAPMQDVRACRSIPKCLAPAKAPLTYPKECVSGRVELLVFADDNGCVCDTEVVESSNVESLDLAAEQAVSQWKWKVPGISRIPIHFQNPRCD
jgi:hypothetical protein